MGRVQQLQREGKNLPSNAALDTRGQLTRDPAKVAALLPFGAHKGYGLGLINEVIAGFIGGSSPTLRGQFPGDDEKHACCYQFIVIHPDALSAGRYAGKRSRKDNLKVIIEDIRQGANKDALLPGEREFRAQQLSEQQGGLFFSEAEITAFTAIAREIEFTDWVPDQYPLASIG